MVFQNSWHSLGSILHIYCTTSQKLYFWYWLVDMLQWNSIGVLLLYDWYNLLGNTSESSLMLLYPRCIQSFPYSESLLWLQFSALNFQFFHQIWYLPCRHPYMVSLDHPTIFRSLESSYCWLDLWYISTLLSTKSFWNLLVIFWLLQNSWVLE